MAAAVAMAHKRLAAHLRRVVAAVGRVAERHREALRPRGGHVGLGPEEPLRVDVGGAQVGPPLDHDLVALVALPRRLLPHVADERDPAPPRGDAALEADHHPAAAHERAIAHLLLPVLERDLQGHRERQGSRPRARAAPLAPALAVTCAGRQPTRPAGVGGWVGGGSDVGGRGGGSVGGRGGGGGASGDAGRQRWQATNKLEFERGEAGKEDPPHLLLPPSAARSKVGTWGKSDGIVGVRGCAGRASSALRRSGTPPASRSRARLVLAPNACLSDPSVASKSVSTARRRGCMRFRSDGSGRRGRVPRREAGREAY